jgi:hypothetical protein
MNNDKKRFVDVTELSKELGLSTSEAVELAVKADAVMKIGSKVWYEKDKAKEYLKNDGRPAIHWLSVASGGKFHDGETEDVIVTLHKPSSKNKNARLRISIKKEVLDGIKQGKKIMVGLAGTRLYLKFSDIEGYAVEKMKERLATTISIRNGIEHFTGGYTLHRSADDLVFIDLKEKK